MIWTGIPGGEEEVPSHARIFAPPVCPVPIKGKYLRVELNYNYRSGFHGIDAIQRFGYTELPIGQVTDILGRLFYEPPVGVYASSTNAFDSFSYVASDCEVMSENPALVKVRLPR